MNFWDFQLQTVRISTAFIALEVPRRLQTKYESTTTKAHWLPLALITVAWCLSIANPGSASTNCLTVEQWHPFLEWEVKNPTYAINPFDLLGTVSFVHSESGTRINTQMYYDGDDIWKYRFTGTIPGKWRFETSSEDKDLDGLGGCIAVEKSDSRLGFVSHRGNRWVRTGNGQAFVPQYVMYAAPKYFQGRPDVVDKDIKIFIDQHGFTGFHIPVFCSWFNIDNFRCERNWLQKLMAKDVNPDPNTFAALEMIIDKVYQAGGVVHLWLWGDEERRMTPSRWGLNGPVDERLQRYIAARLGPMPGWSMGYGFDLWEWVDRAALKRWYTNMHQFLGWKHMLGARSAKKSFTQIYDGLDYFSYEQHRPSYQTYRKTISISKTKPSFSEDRFRMGRDTHRYKDYTFERMRRGLWHSAMAGGVANIWGNLDGQACAGKGRCPSRPYPNAHWIKTYAQFFAIRFHSSLQPYDVPGDLIVLGDHGTGRYILYAENVSEIVFNSIDGEPIANPVAVDALKPYEEIDISSPGGATLHWKAPYPSDWAVSIGNFSERLPQPPRSD